MRRPTLLAALAVALAAALAPAASAAPRLSEVSLPGSVAGSFSAGFGVTCGPNIDSLPMTFVSSAPGTMLVGIQGPSVIGFGIDSFPVRKGSNSVSLDCELGLSGAGRPTNTWRLTFLPVGRLFDPGRPVARTVVVNCS